MSKSVFIPPAEWPDTATETELGELAERAEALRPRSIQAQAIMAEIVELLWLAQQTEIASRLAVWRSQGYRPALLKGPPTAAIVAPALKGRTRSGDAAS